MIEILKPECAGRLVAYRISGKLMRDDVQSAFTKFQHLPSDPLRVSVLGIYDDFDAGGMTFREAIELHCRNFGSVERFAMVGDAPWLRAAVNAIRMLSGCDVRLFSLGDLSMAHVWLESPTPACKDNSLAKSI